jgi:poly(A) polymerase
MRDIWAMQPRFERRTGKSPYKLLEHPRMRAGYDFLLLRCASGEIDAEIGDWWTAFIEGDGATREELLTKKPRAEGDAPAKKRRRSRSRKRRDGAENGSTENGSSAADVSQHGEREPVAGDSDE